MRFPIHESGFIGLPINRHPGAYGAVRLHDIHSGVDLYTRENAPVFAMADGEVVAYEQFTGPPRFPWWKTTHALIVKNNVKGIRREDDPQYMQYICYGEIVSWLQPGDKVWNGAEIGKVVPVLQADKLRKDIPGHSTSMLHLEMYDDTYDVSKNYWDVWGFSDTEPSSSLEINPAINIISLSKPKYLIDPTQYLIKSMREPKFLTV